MGKQIIISIGREYGSAGHAIGELLALIFGIPFYDRNLLDEIAEKNQGDSVKLKRYDEVPRKSFFSRTVKGYSNSPEEIIANMQFEYLREKAESGESFVIVGRCAEHILKGHPALISFFVLGDYDEKVKRIMKVRGCGSDEARNHMTRHDKKRKNYHNYYCDGKWGDSRNYDFSINSSKLGMENTAAMMEYYIRMRMKTMHEIIEYLPNTPKEK